MKIECVIVKKILAKYIKKEINSIFMNIVAKHLQKCPKCMERHFRMKKILQIKDERENRIKIFEEISAEIDFERLKNNIIPDYQISYINKQNKEAHENMVKFIDTIEKSLKRAKDSSKIDVVKEVMSKIN